MSEVVASSAVLSDPRLIDRWMHACIQDGVTVSGLEKIRTAVNNLHLLGLSVDLSNGSVDAQPANGGVLVVVTGHYTPAHKQPSKSNSPHCGVAKPFVQTFYLTATSNVSKLTISVADN